MNTVHLLDLAHELIAGGFWVEGYCTNGKPGAQASDAITDAIESVHGHDVTREDLEQALEDEQAALTIEEWAKLDTDRVARMVAAATVRLIGERRASDAGINTDGYSCLVSFA